jgi:DNA-binding MarR family transcriptional regulator
VKNFGGGEAGRECLVAGRKFDTSLVDLMAAQNEHRIERRLALLRYTFLTMQRLLRSADAILAEDGITTRHWVFLQLLLHDLSDDCPTLAEVARRSGCSPQNIQQIAHQLDLRGYLDFVPDVDDLRLQRLRPTPKAENLDSTSKRRQLARALSPAFDHLDDDEIEACSRRMELWARGLAAEDRRRGDDGG